MSDGPISADGAAVSVSGAELIPMIQGGVNKNTSPTFINALVNKLTTKGDLLSRTSSAPDRLAVGTNGQALLADSTQTLGLRWGDVAVGSGGSAGGSAARAYRSTTQSISDNTETAIAFANETFDTDAIHDNSSNNSRLTVKQPGKQIVLAAVEFAANANGYREVRLRVNGTTYIGVANCVAPSSATPARLIALGDFDGAVNDYVEVTVLQTSGAALNVNSGEGVTWAAIILVGPSLDVSINSQTGTTYTLALTDRASCVEMNNGSSNTLTVPPNASVAFSIGSVVEVRQMGAGVTSIAAGSGVTIRTSSTYDVAGQYATAVLHKRGTNEWCLDGKLA